MAKVKKAVTMADIAKRMDVSTVTVSKALAGQKGVSEEVREKIVALAREMGYRAPGAPRENMEKTGFRIGVLMPASTLMTFDSFYWRLYQSVSEKAMQKNCFTGYESYTEEMAGKKLLPRLITDKMVDGLIIIGRPPAKYGAFLKERAGMPVVFLDFYENEQDVASFISDSFYGTYLLTNYLFDHGHRDIAYVGTLFSTASITDRYMGYLKSMMEHGIQPPADYVIPDRSLEEGAECHDLDFALPKKMPTAFVCNCDVTAEFLIADLREKGFRVPEDVSVVGFDNYPDDRHGEMGITTYAVDIPAMAKAAVKSLIRQMGGENVEKGIHIVEGYLVEKESVGRGAALR